MKTRLGFVSNSSSASYIVTIKEPIENVLDFYIKESSFFWIKDAMKYYHKLLEQLEKRNSRRNLFSFTYTKKIAELKKKIETYDENKDKDKMIRDYLEICGITISGNKKNTTLVANTSMHNTYEGLPEYLKLIIVYYCFTDPKKIVCTINKD